MTPHKLSRRAILRGGVGLGIAALGVDSLAACAPRAETPATSTALPPPETASIRLAFTTCDTPFWVADDVLRDEGFSNVSLRASPTATQFVLRGESDFGVVIANTFVGFADAGQPLVALAGVHPGCLGLWARPGISTISDLKGKTIAVNSKTITFAGKTSPESFYSHFVSMLAHVGIPPGAVNFVEIGADKSRLGAFLDGTSDAVLAHAEENALLRANAKNPGKLILDMTVDRPWSQLYCCLVIGNRDWVKANPVAAKRATRAILRTMDTRVRDRRVAARIATDTALFAAYPGVTESVVYDTIKDLAYDWRDYDPEEAVRYYSLHMNDAKLIKKTPQEIIDTGTDFAYYHQLRAELKA